MPDDSDLLCSVNWFWFLHCCSHVCMWRNVIHLWTGIWQADQFFSTTHTPQCFPSSSSCSVCECRGSWLFMVCGLLHSHSL